MSNSINDDELESVSGGTGGSTNGRLPRHLCGGGVQGELVEIGIAPNRTKKYRCRNCKKEGRINFVSGTRDFCSLI